MNKKALENFFRQEEKKAWSLGMGYHFSQLGTRKKLAEILAKMFTEKKMRSQ